MKTNHFFMNNAHILFVLLIVLAGCGLQERSSTALVSKTEPMIESQTLTAVPIVTLTIDFLATETPAPTYTPTTSVTWTPAPTLDPQAARELVIDLIETNSGCFLPCWWGITPGETSWEEANSFLAPFATKILPLRKDVYGVTYDYLPDSVSEGAIGATITIMDDVVQTISTDVYYPLEKLLFIYGQPEEVWVYADTQSINPEAPFTIALFYKNRGFLAIYLGTTKKEESPQICPDKIAGRQLAWYLWSPSLDMTFQKAGQKALLFVNPSDRRFYKLEDATNTNAMEFYETYRLLENASACFEMEIP
ncbi:MAG TPA: hypothetical protein DD636_03470 [Anaerolineaceae bacterium]|jgi:hypothetical protein|nr:hypothetical protein [Anaerolineaceae bacterium]